MDGMVSKIAGTIRGFALDVRRGVYDDGKTYVAIVNTVTLLVATGRGGVIVYTDTAILCAVSVR